MNLCDENCNECPVILHKNSRMLTYIFNKALERFGDEFYKIVQDNCPNMTVCYDCRIDDFCHVEGCELANEDNQISTSTSNGNLVNIEVLKAAVRWMEYYGEPINDDRKYKEMMADDTYGQSYKDDITMIRKALGK